MAVMDIIQGNLGKVGDLRETKNGHVLHLSVAFTPRFKRGEEWVDGETLWTNVVVWNNEAVNFANSNLAPGTPIVVIGRRQAVKMEAYTTQDGRAIPERLTEQVVADSIAVQVGRWNTVSSTRIQSQNQGGGGSAPSQQGTQFTSKANQTQKSQSQGSTDDIFGGDDDIFGGDDDIFGESPF